MAQAQFNPSAPYAPLTTEESEHERQLAPSRVKPSGLAQFLAPADETANPQAYDPNTLRGYGARVGQALKGAGSSVVGMVDPKIARHGRQSNHLEPSDSGKKDVSTDSRTGTIFAKRTPITHGRGFSLRCCSRMLSEALRPNCFR